MEEITGKTKTKIKKYLTKKQLRSNSVIITFTSDLYNSKLQSHTAKNVCKILGTRYANEKNRRR